MCFFFLARGFFSSHRYHKLLLGTQAFIDGDIDTGFIQKHGDELTTPPPISNVKKFLDVPADKKK